MRVASVALAAALIALTGVPAQGQTSREISNWHVTEWDEFGHSNVTASVRTAGNEEYGTPAQFTASCIKRAVDTPPETTVTVRWNGPLDAGQFEYDRPPDSYFSVTGTVSGETGDTIEVTTQQQDILRDIVGGEGPVTLRTSIMRTNATATFQIVGALEALTLVANACDWPLAE